MPTSFEFVPNTTRWNAKNALASALASKLAYENPQTVAQTARQWGFERTDFIDAAHSDTQLFVTSNASTVLVAFRGTQPDDLKDWITDADVVMAHTDLGPVHYGFWLALRSVWPRLEAALASHRDRGQSLWITGHSLGAALATLATARLRQTLVPINGLYTFGSPRPGSNAFSDRFDHDFGDFTFRYVNNADIVTRLPTRSMGYSHVGTTLMFDAEGQVQADSHWWNSFLERVRGTLTEMLHGNIAAFADHASEHYVDNAQKNLAINPFA